MARLLISVRSGLEAEQAVRAGADIIDIKEPARGSLGRAPCHVWSEVVSVCNPSIPVSVALGELTEWLCQAPPTIPTRAWDGLAFRKMGLAYAPEDWASRWAALRYEQPGPPWIAVAYADWQSARAPTPDAVLEVASACPDLVGVLVDTCQKGHPFRPDSDWNTWAARVRQAGLLLAMAGGLDADTIGQLGPLQPDILAVRGAACLDGRRNSPLDPNRVVLLARRVAGLSQ